uniref:UDP-glucose ceramide glucosyltransferase-like 1 n=1 Tax=Gadus morhua TaxID=8049 RepID=A0A8C5AD04_GADMO
MRNALLFTLWLMLTTHHASAASKGVSASLKAKWTMTPFLLETRTEVRRLISQSHAHCVVTAQVVVLGCVSDAEPLPSESVRSYYNLILKKAGQFLTHLQVNLLRFALSLRTYSPAVAASQQIASDEDTPASCPAFVSVHGQLGCSTKDLKKLLKGALDRPKPCLYKTDHRYPGRNVSDVPVVVLYAEIGTRKFSAFHTLLSERAEAGSLIYVLRHFVEDPQPHKVLLSGYAVELAIKSTEYRAVDDTQVKGRFKTSCGLDEMMMLRSFLLPVRKSHPELQGGLGELRKHLVESSDDMAPLKVWELQDLSFQAAAKILSVPKFDALKLMRDLSQDFPSKARLTLILMDTSLTAGSSSLQRLSETLGLHPGDAALFINGQNIDLDTHTPFSILDMLRGEARVLEGLHNLGVTGEHQGKMLRLPVGVVEDSYALDIRHPAIMWMNDIESDPMYRGWPSGVQELLRSTFPGVIRQIRRNFFNLVLFLDPAHQQTVELVKLSELFYKHMIPLRIGFIFVVNTEEEVDGFTDVGVAFYRLLSYIAEEYDLSQALTSVVSMYSKIRVGESLSVDTITAFLKRKFPKANAGRILGLDSEYDERRQAGPRFYQESGLGALPVALFNGVPLDPGEMDPEELETLLLQRIMDATNVFQRAAFMGQLTEASDVEDYLMEQPHVVLRINPLVLSTERRYLDFTASPGEPPHRPAVASLHRLSLVAAVTKVGDEDGMSGVTTWIVGDLETEAGQRLLAGALKHRKSPGVRVGVIDNPGSSRSGLEDTRVYRALWSALLTQKNKVALEFTQTLLKGATQDLLKGGAKMKDLLLQVTSGQRHAVDLQLFCRDVLKLGAGQRAVVANGRVSSPVRDAESSARETMHLLNFIPASCLHRASELIMKVDALLSGAPKGETRKDVPFPKDVLSQVVNLELQVFMNCRAKLSEMPLKSFYRLVLEADVNFLANDTMSPGPTARFSQLPESPLLTLNMITPDGWMVEAVSSPHDLDNIHLQEVNAVVRAEYELEHLLLEGHCFDLTTGQPPRGLQFTLGTGQRPLRQDTIVMANLGYFQLKANPGAWILKLRKGRSEDIYQILTHDGTDSPDDAGDVVVTLNSFQSKIIKLVVRCVFAPGFTRPCRRLTGSEVSVRRRSCVTRLHRVLFSITGGSSRPSDAEKKEDVLNIFSVASGHLYERFLRIMMLSVLRHTKTPVKFWFLKNFLSPSFKESIPHLAEEYGFQYELVHYKWPRWLHQQTEKQRLIWGYKILFLDVLFPLAVDKIIFVDADQIVRADLKELRDLPLDGAPYGYTPFCESRREMDGYRFWKSGYWASHLGHRKYHISALYVVDLKKFRKIAAGDRLRGQYQALSQDPNSLSNLDQDLPNNMIHQVAIKSLPQEWLWCETWCDDASKGNAKTIDLCNNPRTKEPKLTAAARIVPEWVEYDNDIKRLLRRIQDGRGGDDEAITKPNKEQNYFFTDI